MLGVLKLDSIRNPMNTVQTADNRPLFLKPGHNAGDLVEATQWKILREEKGLVEVEAHLPAHLLNPRNQLFGGFTGIYVDMISLYTCRTCLLYTSPSPRDS